MRNAVGSTCDNGQATKTARELPMAEQANEIRKCMELTDADLPPADGLPD